MATDEVIRAMELLGLKRGFDSLALKRAYRKLIYEAHPDRNDHDTTQYAVLVNRANEILLDYLAKTADEDEDVDGQGFQGDDVPEAPNAGDIRPEWYAPPPLRVRDNRGPELGGALWPGIVVPDGTRLPEGWGRRRIDGEIWTRMEGDAEELIEALWDDLDPNQFSMLPQWVDNRPGGSLWSGFQVEPGDKLPSGWQRAGRGRHAGEAWTTQAGDARTLIDQLRISLADQAR